MKLKLLPIFLLTALTSFAQGTGEVIITEIYNRPLKPSQEQLDAALPNNPPGADTSPNEGHTEWFEVYNTTDNPVVMDGWTLTDASSSSNESTIGSFTLAPKSYAVFAGFNIPEAQGGVEFDYFYDYRKPSFNNESSYADADDDACPDGVVIRKADGTLVDEVRYDYGYGEYIGNPSSNASCSSAEAAIGIPAMGSSSRVSFMLVVDPAVMNASANDLASNWVFSTSEYDSEGGQVGTPGMVNDGSTSIDQEVLENSIRVFPNPVKDVIYIESNIQDEMRVELFDLIGQRISNITMNNNQIDVSNFQTGMYLLKINVDGASVVRKIIIQ